MGLENPGWFSFHPLIKQFPEVLTGASPLHISVVDEGESQICSPGFSLAYSAASALLFQIPAKIKAQKGKLSLWASTRTQVLHTQEAGLHWEERSSSLSFSITWLAMLSSPNPAHRTPWSWVKPSVTKDQLLHTLPPCQCIYCTSAVLPSTCSWAEQASR